MKRVLVTLSVLLLSTATFAQSEKFVKAMQTNLALLDSAKTTEEFNALSATFERIGEAEKTQWLPYYYAALTTIWKGFADSKLNKDDVANKAEAMIAKAETLEPKNAELHILKNMTSTLHMLVDPMSRWQQYGTQGSAALSTAKQLDENNPRIYFLEGQTLMGTPAQFGGGKDKAKPLFEKSVNLFATFKPASSLHPTWGEATAKTMLERCK